MDIENEVKKQLAYLRSLQSYLAESTSNVKDFSRIIDLYRNPIHRNIKLNCYPLLKTMPAQELVALELEKEFSNQDFEIQLCSLKLAYCLPISKLMQIIKQNDSAIYQIIEGSFEFHYERLSAINSILIQLLTRETEVDVIDMPKQAINNIYVRIAENCFNNNRDISANCILCLTSLFQQNLYNQNNLTKVKYDYSYIRAYLIPRILLLKERIFSYEIRIRVKMIQLLPQLLKTASIQIKAMSTIVQNQNTEFIDLDLINFQFQLAQQITEQILKYTFELDTLVLCGQCVLAILIQNSQYQQFSMIHNQIGWNLFSYINNYICKIGYKKELNQILVSLLQLEIDQNSKIAISMRILEISNQIPNQLTRNIFMLYAFDNLAQCSIELINQKKGSALMGLYNSPWFLSQLKDEPEELIYTMIIATINTTKNKQMLIELMDISNGSIWDGCNIEAIILFLLLIEECTNLIPQNELNLSDLINRITTNQIGFMQKVQILLILTKKYNQSTLTQQLEYTQILTELRTFLIQPISTPITQKNLIQNIYIILYHLVHNFHNNQNHLKQQILEILSDYNDNLIQRKNEKVAEYMVEFNKSFVGSIQQNEQLQMEQLQLKIDQSTESYLNQNLHLDPIQIAYNIFYLKQFSSEQDSLIANLKAIYSATKNIYTELQVNAQLITGVSDFCQIYCAHVIDLSKSTLCLAINIINNCPFKLDNLGIKILLDRNCSLQNNYKLIEELPSYQQTQLFFVVNFNPKESMHFAFDIILQDVRTETSSFTIRTQNYRISLIEFLVPNYFIHLSQSAIQYINYEQSLIINGYLMGSYLLLVKKLKDKPFAVGLYDGNNAIVFEHSIKQNWDQVAQVVSPQVKICLLAYQMSGNILGIEITNISTNQEQCDVLIEIKSDKQCVNVFRRELDKLFNELFDGIIQYQF